jgi:hypothetical protein
VDSFNGFLTLSQHAVEVAVAATAIAAVAASSAAVVACMSDFEALYITLV